MLKKDKINILLIVVLTLIVGGLCLKFLPSFPVISDAERYDTIALNAVQGKGLTYNNEPTIEPPGYPFFLSGIYWLFGHNYQIVKFIQFLLLAGIGIIIYFIGRKFLNFPPSVAFLSSLTLILWPYFILYTNFIVTEILFIFLLLLSIYFLLTLFKDPSLKNSLILGGLLGLVTLVKPIPLLLPFWMVFFLWIFFRPTWKKTYFFKLAIILIVFVAVLTPWIIRNYLHFNQFIPISGHLSNVIERAYVKLDYTEGSQVLKPGEADLKTVILARLKNIYLFWNPGAGGAHAKTLKEAFPIMGTLFYVYRILFFAILSLAFWSLRWIRQNKEIALFWMIIFYFWAFHTVFYPYPRYTLPIIPLVIMLAWFSIQKLLKFYLPHSAK